MTKHRVYILASCALALSFAAYRTHSKGAIPAAISPSILQPMRFAPALARALHPNYPYSVIPGGVYSPAELVYAVGKDRVVRDHYAGFNLKAARLVALTQDRLEYVSYRRGDRVFWTGKKLRIPRGELLLTDGRNFARTRCGNRLCISLRGHVDPHEPSADLLSLPEPNPETLAIGPLKFTPGPSLGELAQEADTLPEPPSRLKPVLPADNQRTGVTGISPAVYNPAGGFFAGIPGMLAYGAPVGATAGSTPAHTTPGVPGNTPVPGSPPAIPPPTLSAVPEPKGLGVIVGIFCVCLLGLVRFTCLPSKRSYPGIPFPADSPE